MEEPRHIVYAWKAPFYENENSVKTKSLFKFPKAPERRSFWKHFCGIDVNFDGVDKYRVCEDHSEPSDFVARRRIATWLIPSRRNVAPSSAFGGDHDYCLG